MNTPKIVGEDGDAGCPFCCDFISFSDGLGAKSLAIILARYVCQWFRKGSFAYFLQLEGQTLGFSPFPGFQSPTRRISYFWYTRFLETLMISYCYCEGGNVSQGCT